LIVELVEGHPVDNVWLDRYVDAWVLHADAGAENGADLLQALLERLSPDVRYEDVPTAAVFSGHEGIDDMCRAAHGVVIRPGCHRHQSTDRRSAVRSGDEDHRHP
jgi:hypothetical protein